MVGALLSRALELDALGREKALPHPWVRFDAPIIDFLDDFVSGAVPVSRIFQLLAFVPGADVVRVEPQLSRPASRARCGRLGRPPHNWFVWRRFPAGGIARRRSWFLAR